MAIAVLPYPSIDFTPLDVLTADELDQIVANINAINSATIPTNVSDLTNDSNFLASSQLSYSTTQTDTGRKWIDNKTIYRKVIHFGSAPNNTQKSVAHGIASLDTLVSITGFGVYTDKTVPLPLLFSDTTYDTQLWVDGTYIYMGNSSDRSMYDCYVILEYTIS